jgi:hypothetical protein
MNHFHTIMREVHRVAQVDSVLNAIPVANAIAPANCMDSMNRVSDLGPFPIDLTIFYSEQKECADQRNRSGQITANFDGLYSALGTTILITLVDYKADNFLISGNITMEVVKSVIDTLGFKATIANGNITNLNKAGNNTSYFEGALSFSNTTGRKTIPTTDDNFVITGEGLGIAENGVIYTYEIENDMVLLPTCEYERFGSFRLKAPNTGDRICNVNEGDGCDRIIQVTIPPANGSQTEEME